MGKVQLKTFRFISWNFRDQGGAKAAHAMLIRCDLRHEASQEMGVEEVERIGGEEHRWNRGTGGSVRLPADDPRIALLLRELRGYGIEPFLRTDRIYSQTERDRAAWVRVLASSTMVLTGRKGQEWDHSEGCVCCGAGAESVPPLVVLIEKMPKSGFVISCPCGHVVATKSVAETLCEKQLTGLRIEPVRRPSSDSISDEYVWLRVDSVWPRWSESTITNTEEVCDVCHRAGHYDVFDGITDLDYDHVPESACDFNVTWEQFGYWRCNEKSQNRVLRGAAPCLILSRRAKEVLRGIGVRLQVQPVLFRGEVV